MVEHLVPGHVDTDAAQFLLATFPQDVVSNASPNILARPSFVKDVDPALVLTAAPAPVKRASNLKQCFAVSGCKSLCTVCLCMTLVPQMEGRGANSPVEKTIFRESDTPAWGDVMRIDIPC